MSTSDPSDDTIAAIATPPGRGGIGIVRVSGPLAGQAASRILHQPPLPRQARFGSFWAPDGSRIDEGIALWFPAPHSFTGEDVLELQGHGGPVVLDMVLEAVLACGVRIAHPGEFSERAFLNGKLDLVQAEAIADLIDSGSRQAARSALRSLQGDFSRQIEQLVEALIALRMYVESAIDFSDEEIDFLADGAAQERLADCRSRLQCICQAASQGRILREGMTVVLAGLPNAGKSSLLNALAGADTAIVTDIPGTTRDLLREQIQIDGMPLHIIDTAGLREAADRVEEEGIRRAWSAIHAADSILLVIDDTAGDPEAAEAILNRFPAELPVTVVRNKVDLSGTPVGQQEGARGIEICLSARTGNGIDLLRSHLKHRVGYEHLAEGTFIARRRHLDALNAAAGHLQQAERHLTQGVGELLAEELRLAQQELSTITGEFTSDDLLGRIFASFCIGK